MNHLVRGFDLLYSSDVTMDENKTFYIMTDKHFTLYFPVCFMNENAKWCCGCGLDYIYCLRRYETDSRN